MGLAASQDVQQTVEDPIEDLDKLSIGNASSRSTSRAHARRRSRSLIKDASDVAHASRLSRPLIKDKDTSPTYDRKRSAQLQPKSRVLEEVQAQEVSQQRLHELLREYASQDPDAEAFGNTLVAVADLLMEGVGGMIVGVLHQELTRDNLRNLKVDSLDDGTHSDCFRELVGNIHAERKTFKQLLGFLTAHSASDRWENTELEGLVKELPATKPWVEQLVGQPKDGAILMTHRGSIEGVSLLLKYNSRRYQLIKTNGKSAGTRHASALALAEWLADAAISGVCPGAIFVRSDGGGAEALIPPVRGGSSPGPHPEPPAAHHFRTRRIPNQQDMLGWFKDTILQKGCLMRKQHSVLAREGVRGETVVTLVAGRVTSYTTIADSTSMVLRANTVDQELYCLPMDVFRLNYEVPGADLNELEADGESSFCISEKNQLLDKGFKLYRPRAGNLRWMHMVTDQDLEKVSTGCFEAKWGVVQPLRKGDFLGMPDQKLNEIYLIPQAALANYSLVWPDEGRSGAMTQAQMLSHFRERIMTDGQLFYKTEPVLVRKAIRGERVIATINGKITALDMVWDNTSLVLRGRIHDDTYVLSQEDFKALWETNGSPIAANDQSRRHLAAEGFRLHYPNPANSRRWVYVLTEEDVEGLACAQMETAWGKFEDLNVGDALTLLAPEEGEGEVYVSHPELAQTLSASASRRMGRRRPGLSAIVRYFAPQKD